MPTMQSMKQTKVAAPRNAVPISTQSLEHPKQRQSPSQEPPGRTQPQVAAYDDDRLFAAALQLLEITYTQRRRLLTAVEEVTLLPDRGGTLHRRN